MKACLLHSNRTSNSNITTTPCESQATLDFNNNFNLSWLLLPVKGNHCASPLNGKYYKTDPESIKIFNKPSSKSSGTGGLTANQQAKAAQLAAKEAGERAKLSDTRSTRPVEAGNGKTRIVWSGKGWVKQDKASGGWVEDIDSPSIRSKTEAGKAYLGL